MRQIVLPIWAIALNSLKESIRNKVLLSLLGFAMLTSLLAVLLGQMSMHEQTRVAMDFFFATSTVFGVVIAVYSSVTLLNTEIERRTIYTIMSKPIDRYQFVVGKFFGVQLVNALSTTILGLVGYLTFRSLGGDGSNTIYAFGALYLQLSILTAFAIFFASLITPLFSGVCSIGIFVAGNLHSQWEDIALLLRNNNHPAHMLIDGLKQVLPNMEALNLSRELVYNTPIPREYVLSSIWYAAVYCAAILFFASLLFSRRQFQ